jgi:signal transduction histidine kinase
VANAVAVDRYGSLAKMDKALTTVNPIPKPPRRSPSTCTNGSKTGIQQVLSILLTNANRHAGSNDEVSMTLEVALDSVRLRVTDTGTGIILRLSR